MKLHLQHKKTPFIQRGYRLVKDCLLADKYPCSFIKSFAPEGDQVHSSPLWSRNGGLETVGTCFQRLAPDLAATGIVEA